MKTTYIIAGLAAIAAGYLAARQLRQYQPFTAAYSQGAKLAM
jgi:drug/metabolite transporter superfamily protein YnfA